MTDSILKVEQLAKTYRTHHKEAGLKGSLKALFHRKTTEVHAVHPVTFSIQRGEFVGLLGPNGAGKTTTLKMLTGLIRPTSGHALAFGQFDTATRPSTYLRRIGMVMGQRNQLNPDLPAIDSFKMAEAIYDLDSKRAQARVQSCLEMFGILDKAQVPVRKLSLGERMKMELTLSLLHEPELLFLDEPTIGLDFTAARQIRDFLKETNRQFGVTIILTSHYTKDIEELCRRVILINQGHMAYDGPLSDIDAQLQGQRTISLIHRDVPGADKTRSALASPEFHEVTVSAMGEDPTLVQCSVPSTKAWKTISRLPDHLEIEDIKIAEQPLEEIFARLYATKRPT